MKRAKKAQSEGRERQSIVLSFSSQLNLSDASFSMKFDSTVRLREISTS